jgi:hypothetical protein
MSSISGGRLWGQHVRVLRSCYSVGDNPGKRNRPIFFQPFCYRTEGLRHRGMPVTDNPVAVLSPSKVKDLANYFMYYPRSQLRTDVFLDFILYPKLSLQQTGFGAVFAVRDIERRPWPTRLSLRRHLHRP